MITRHMEANYPVTRHQVRAARDRTIPPNQKLFDTMDKRSIRNLHRPTSLDDQKKRAFLDSDIAALVIGKSNEFHLGVAQIYNSQNYRNVIQNKSMREFFVRMRALQLAYCGFDEPALNLVKASRFVLESYGSIGLIEDLDMDLDNPRGELIGHSGSESGGNDKDVVGNAVPSTHFPIPQFIRLEVLQNQHQEPILKWCKIRDEFVSGYKDRQEKYGKPGSQDGVGRLQNEFEEDMKLYNDKP